jgi:alpha-beta hydrolase superfamily lysophospholipase
VLAERFAALTYDRRGRGESGDGGRYAVEREVEDLAALIAEAGGSARAYGISSGAVLALEAAKRGVPLAKLALYEAPFVVDDSRPPVPGDYRQRLDELIALGPPRRRRAPLHGQGRAPPRAARGDDALDAGVEAAEGRGPHAALRRRRHGRHPRPGARCRPSAGPR